MKERTTVLIIAEPGQVRDGLCALLHAMPGVNVVDRPCDGILNTDLLAEHSPSLILLDCNLVNTRVLDALGRFKTQDPEVGFLLLVKDVKQQQLARNAGISHALIKGTSAEKLAETVKELLIHRTEQGGPSDE